jgi:glycosyltransferase involved in cell wall biosynthesis
MNICLLAPEFPPIWGGVGTYSFELVKHLPKTIDIHILTPRRQSFVGVKKNFSEVNTFDQLGENIHVHYISEADDSFRYNAAFQYACLKYVPKLVQEERIDLIHSHTAHMPDLLLMFRNLNLPTLTTVHTTIKSQRIGTTNSKCEKQNLENSEKSTSFLYPFLRIAENLYFTKKRFLITPSAWMSKWLIANYPIQSSIKVIPNCVNPDDYKVNSQSRSLDEVLPKNIKNKKIVLYAGRLLALKGVDVLIQAVPKVLETVKDEVLFVFAGSGVNSGLLHKIEADPEHLLFTGPLQKDLLIPLMAKSTLTVLPSYHENCPYSVLESMACGTPVVATNVGGLPEIITHNYDGLLVDCGSPNSLAWAILRVLQDDDFRNELGKRAKSTIIKRFSWQKNISKYLDAYYETLK